MIESVLNDAAIESVSSLETVIAADKAALNGASEWMKAR